MLKENQICTFTNKGSWTNSRLDGEKVIIKKIYDYEVVVDFLEATSMGHRLANMMVDIEELNAIYNFKKEKIRG